MIVYLVADVAIHETIINGWSNEISVINLFNHKADDSVHKLEYYLTFLDLSSAICRLSSYTLH